MSATRPEAAPRQATLRGLALAGARASWTGTLGTGLVIALASCLTTVTGVLLESGLREPDGGLLVTLASSFAGTALLLAVGVVAATTTLALRGRRRELALLRTVGATRGQVRRLVSTELLVLGAVAAPIGGLPGLLVARSLDPVLREGGIVAADFTATLSPLPVLGAVLLVVPTALLAGRLAARETLRDAPTTALRESAAEAVPVGRARRTAAVVTAAAGLLIAATPLVVPGTIGAALAATSAFLLIAAAALAGPVLVEWVFGSAARLRPGGPAATRLALGNLRGFSRRLTVVVVPLALAIAVGTTQGSVDDAVQRAATEQLDAALGTELVATSPTGLSDGELAALAASPDVSAVVPLGDAPAEIRTDDELPAALAWESTTLTAVPPEVDAARLDPGVVRGSLAALAAPDTIAVSSDDAFETGRGLGESLTVRLGEDEVDLEVVAVFDRGLGLAGQLVGPRTLAAHGVSPVVRLALVEAPATTATTTSTATTSTAAYVAAATSPDAAAQRLSTILTLLLLIFVGLGAINALVLVTAGRRGELRLLHRTGATARQLMAMSGVEAVVIALAAWVIGTVAVLPALGGVSVGLLGAGVPVLDLTTWGALSGAVVVATVLATLLTAARTVRAATRSTS